MTATNEKREDRLSSRGRRKIRESVRALSESAGKENWDGENALPVTPKNLEIAESIADLFPSSAFLPEVSATPQGEIDFDWIVSKNMMLTLSVCPTGEIAYSGTLDIEGTEEWNGRMPSDVVCWLDGLRKMPAETGG